MTAPAAPMRYTPTIEESRALATRGASSSASVDSSDGAGA